MAEEKKKSRKERMYADSPKMERGEDGNMGVKKKNAAVEAGGDASGEKPEHTAEAMPMHVAHSMARADMHKRHEAEHMVHDHHKAGSKKELHERHEKEAKALHAQHEKEMEKGKEKESKEPEKKEGKEKTGEKEIEKVEKEK